MSAISACVLRATGFEVRGEHLHRIDFRHVGGEPVQLAFGVAFASMLDRAAGDQADGDEGW